MKKTRYWIMKSEPSEFSITDLEQRREAFWDGIRNYQVRNMIRDVMAIGDKALFYHSSCKEVGVVGEMEIVSTATADPAQFDASSKYYDPASSRENPRWLGVKVRHVSTFDRVVLLSDLRTEPSLASLQLLRPGNRLSITECTKSEYTKVVQMAKRQK
jgi:predicted RNA-binding protein with PUA-like domain